MQKTITWICILFFPIITSAQSRKESFFSVTASAGFTNAGVNSAKRLLPANTSQAIRFNYGLHAWYNRSLSNKFDLQVGIGYNDVGFRKQQKDAKFQDPTYPGMGDGQIIDLTNTRKDINYDYRFHYIQVPVWFNYNVFKSADFRSDYMLTGGVAANVLVKHHLTARLENFTVDGKDKFQFDSTGLKAGTISASLNIGARLEHKLDKTTTIIIQPMFQYYPFSVTGSDVKVYPLSLMVHAGLVINIGGKE